MMIIHIIMNKKKKKKKTKKENVTLILYLKSQIFYQPITHRNLRSIAFI